MAEHGIAVSHQTTLTWAEKFGRQFAADIRRRSAGQFSDKWHLDEVVITMSGKNIGCGAMSIGMAFIVLDVLVQSRRNSAAANHPTRNHL